MVEFGGARITPITLAKPHVDILSTHLERLYNEQCNASQYTVKDGDFKLSTSGVNKVAKLTLNKQTINLKLDEIKYLMTMFYVVRNQLDLFLSVQQDLMIYVTSALSSTTYVTPDSNLSPLINYTQLFEELKTML